MCPAGVLRPLTCTLVGFCARRHALCWGSAPADLRPRLLKERLEANKGEYKRKEAARQREAQRVRAERCALRARGGYPKLQSAESPRRWFLFIQFLKCRR